MLWGPPCTPFSRLSTKRKERDYNPFQTPPALGWMDGSRYIRLMAQQVLSEFSRSKVAETYQGDNWQDADNINICEMESWMKSGKEFKTFFWRFRFVTDMISQQKSGYVMLRCQRGCEYYL